VVRRLAVLALAGCVLAGCGGSKEPKSDPTPATVGPSSPSPSPTAAPTLPDAARANTKAGAIAFVRFYIDAFNHAQATGDTSMLALLEGPACRSCREVRQSIEHTYRAGGHAVGGALSIDGQEIHRSVGRQWVVDVAGHFSPSTIYASAGATPQHDKGGSTAASFFVRFNDGWEVVRWTRAT
jgi:hypothetical protein